MRPSSWFALLLTLGCATAPKPRWADDAQLKWDASRYPDDAAVVLYRADRTHLKEDGANASTLRSRHEVIAIQGEQAFRLAEVRVGYRAVDKLVEFSARIIQPDGSTQEFDARNFLGSASGRGEQDGNAAVFRFPNVKVGSVLEYRWAVESQNFSMSASQDTLGEYPVKHYEFELTAARSLVIETIALNTRTPIRVETRANGEHVLRFSLSDLPASTSADFAPHWTFREPRWAWRAVAYKPMRITYDWLRDWHDVVDQRSAWYFTDRALTEGFAPSVDVSGCTGAHCKVERALAVIREKTTTRGVGPMRAEPLRRVWDSGAASVTERALMLKSLLERMGLEVWLAWGTDALSRQTAPTFPNFDQFNHLFVYLPAQTSLAKPLVVDAACDACAAGELLPRNAGQKLYAFRATSTLGRSTTRGAWLVPEAKVAQGSRYRVSHQARLDERGTVLSEVSVDARGRESERHVERFEKGGDGLGESERSAWRKANPLARLESAKHGACSRLEAHCAWQSQLEFPLQAVRDGDAWLVHLGFLRPIYADLFDAPTRDVDVHFAFDDETWEEVLELTAPAGTTLAQVPPPVRLSAGPMQTEVVVERTPTGAKLTRRMAWSLDEVKAFRYPELRQVADVFKRVRMEVLVFTPAGAASASSAATR